MTLELTPSRASLPGPGPPESFGWHAWPTRKQLATGRHIAHPTRFAPQEAVSRGGCGGRGGGGECRLDSLEAIGPDVLDLFAILGFFGLVAYSVSAVAPRVAHPGTGLGVELVEVPAHLVLLHEMEHLDLDAGWHVALVGV